MPLSPVGLSRRSSLRFAASASALALLAACANTPSGDAISSDVKLISDAFNTLLGYVGQLPASLQPSAATIAQIQAELAALNSAAASIAGVLTPDAGTIQKIASAVKLIATLLGPVFPVAPIIGSIVSAGLSLLPGLLAAVGIATATKASLLTPAQAARLTLQAVPH